MGAKFGTGAPGTRSGTAIATPGTTRSRTKSGTVPDLVLSPTVVPDLVLVALSYQTWYKYRYTATANVVPGLEPTKRTCPRCGHTWWSKAKPSARGYLTCGKCYHKFKPGAEAPKSTPTTEAGVPDLEPEPRAPEATPTKETAPEATPAIEARLKNLERTANDLAKRVQHLEVFCQSFIRRISAIQEAFELYVEQAEDEIPEEIAEILERGER